MFQSAEEEDYLVRHLATRIHFAYLFIFKFCNPSGEQRIIALISMRKQKTMTDIGSFSQI